MTQPLILLAVLRVARITIGARIYCKFFVGQLPLTLPSVRPSQGYDYRADSSIRRQTMLCTVTKGIDLEANDLGCGKLRCLAGPGDVIQRRAINMTPFGHLFGYVAGTEIGGGGVKHWRGFSPYALVRKPRGGCELRCEMQRPGSQGQK